MGQPIQSNVLWVLQAPVSIRTFSCAPPVPTSAISEEQQKNGEDIGDSDTTGNGTALPESGNPSQTISHFQPPTSEESQNQDSDIPSENVEAVFETDLGLDEARVETATNETIVSYSTYQGYDAKTFDELARMDAAKDADELNDDLTPTYRARMQDMPGYIDFKLLNSWQDVEAAVVNAGVNIKAHEIVAAFTRLKQIMGRSNTRFLFQLSEKVIQQAPELNSWMIAAVFHACGKLRYKNAALFDALATEMLKLNNTRKLYSREIANCVYSLGILSRFEILVHAAEMGIRVADMFHLYSTEPPPILFDQQYELLEALCKEMTVVHRLTDFTSQELANTIYGLGLLRHRNTAALKALAREVTNLNHLTQFSAVEISMLVYGFGLLNYQEDSLYDTISGMVIKAGKEEEFSTQHIANVLYGLARANYSGRRITEVLCKEILKLERLSGFREQEVSNIISCLAMLDAGTPKVYDALLKEVIKPYKIEHYVVHNLSNILVGLAQAQHRNEEVLDVLSQELMKPERILSLTSRDLEDIVVSMNALNYANIDLMVALASELRKTDRHEKGGENLWIACRANLFSWGLITPYP